MIKRILSPVLLCVALTSCSSAEKDIEDEFVSAPVEAASPPDDGQPALGVSTVASLISANSMMIREPERFKKALCSDGNIYDLEYESGRFSLRAEPLSVCVLFSDMKNFKSTGFCGDVRCENNMVEDCSESDKKQLIETFAKDQSAQKCWNVGNFPPTVFTILTTRIGQSCQAQTLVKTLKGWQQLNTIDGTFETRKTETSEGQGCWFEAGNTQSFEGDWFTRDKKVSPVMTFDKSGGAYALLKTTWSGTENFQLFRLDGEKAMEVESFAETFKDPLPDPVPPPPPAPAPEPKVQKGKVKKAKKSQKSDAPAPVPTEEAASPVEEATSPTENPPEVPQSDAPSPPQVPEETGVNPLEGEQ
ncbi:MAG: hypothetical protein V4655_07345 [Bdellovibrionota bacterium]